MSTNNITGDKLVSKELSPQGKANWDLIWGKKKEQTFEVKNGIEYPTMTIKEFEASSPENKEVIKDFFSKLESGEIDLS